MAASSASDHNGQTLLHIAVAQDRADLVKLLASDRKLCEKRNAFGMTPLDLAQFLYRLPLIQSLGGKAPAPFCSQPSVAIEREQDREKLRELTYLPYPIFPDSQTLDEILNRSSKAKLDDVIPPEKIWMGIYFDKEIQRGLIPKIAIRWIDDEVGFGIFAAQKIPSCAFVGEYTGLIQKSSKQYLQGKTYCVRYTTWQMGRRKFTVDAENQGNFTRFINHSSTPNIGLQSVYWRGMPRMIFITLKEIPLGAQLTFDYGQFFWKECSQTPKQLS